MLKTWPAHREKSTVSDKFCGDSQCYVYVICSPVVSALTNEKSSVVNSSIDRGLDFFQPMGH